MILDGDSKRNCLLCGNEFTPRNGVQVYCSKTCRKLARKQRDNAKIPPFRICKHCGAKFEPTSNIQQYCSEDCRLKAESERRARRCAEARKVLDAETKACAVCGREFHPAHWRQTCCSDECRAAKKSEWNKKYKRIKYGSKDRMATCIICGKQFESFHGKVCCSVECDEENTRRHKREHAQKMYRARLAMREHGTCPVCGKDFVKKHSHDVYCSAICALEARRRKSAKAREKRAAEPPSMKPCKRCGTPYLHRGKMLQLCDECRKAYYKDKARAQAERTRQFVSERAPKPSRKCHDCGRPTWDYRCPDCLRKWRIKNKVPEDGGGITDQEDMHVWI